MQNVHTIDLHKSLHYLRITEEDSTILTQFEVKDRRAVELIRLVFTGTEDGQIKLSLFTLTKDTEDEALLDPILNPIVLDKDTLLLLFRSLIFDIHNMADKAYVDEEDGEAL